MKKMFLGLVLCLGFLLSGCEQVQELTGQGSSEVDYSVLASVIASPSSNNSLEGKTIEFVAFVVSDVYTSEFDADDKLNGHKYVDVIIARKPDEVISVNVEDIKKTPKAGDYLEIKAKVDGYIYGTVDGNRVENMHVVAKEVKEYKIEKHKDAEKDKFKTDAGVTYKFKDARAQVVTDVFDKQGLIIYYDAEAKDDVRSVGLGDFYIYQNDTLLESNIMSLDSDIELDPSAQKADTFAELKAGEKGRFYYQVSGIEDTTSPITIEKYNDHFELIFICYIAIG